MEVAGKKIDLSLCKSCEWYMGNNTCGYATCGCNVAMSHFRGICPKIW
jgi:hypothetical protein